MVREAELGADERPTGSEADPFQLRGLAALAQACGDDALFANHSRWFRGTIEVRYGEAAFWLSIAHGRVVALGIGENSQADLGLVGDAATWDEILDGLPGGLHRAWRQRMLIFDGDPVTLLRNYMMVWRLGEMMVHTRWRD